jgi:glyoxylase I family protein
MAQQQSPRSEEPRAAAAPRRQEQLREQYLVPPAERSPSRMRGLRHAVFVCRDAEETILFYRDVLGCPLAELTGDRDHPGSTRFFVDVGDENTIGFLEFPGRRRPEYQETIGASHHLALSVGADALGSIRAQLDERSIPYLVAGSGVAASTFVIDPNGLMIELIPAPPEARRQPMRPGLR